LREYTQTCNALRQQNMATLPVALSIERAINPFLRSRSSAVASAVRQRDAHALDDVTTFAALRSMEERILTNSTCPTTAR
jgi:hydroxyacylglutathione hydrolase